jgi:hypothetical protein
MECRNLWSGHVHGDCQAALAPDGAIDSMMEELADDLLMDRGHWTTRDGQRLRIRDMTDSHLGNTIRFMHRKIAAGERVSDEVPTGLAGLFGSEIARFEEKSAELEAEAGRRGLEVVHV